MIVISTGSLYFDSDSLRCSRIMSTVMDVSGCSDTNSTGSSP